MNDKVVKRIRKEMRKRKLDWRNVLYQIVRVPSARSHTRSALQARLSPKSGRYMYHRIKLSVQTNQP